MTPSRKPRPAARPVWRGTIIAPLVRQLPWSHSLAILWRCKSLEERRLYLETAALERWSRRELERQVDGGLFLRAVANPAQALVAVAASWTDAPAEFKDSYPLEFLDLPWPHLEKDLRRGLELAPDRSWVRAISYQNDYAGVFQSIEQTPHPKLEREVTVFLAMWLKNLDEQGFGRPSPEEATRRKAEFDAFVKERLAHLDALRGHGPDDRGLEREPGEGGGVQ